MLALTYAVDLGDTWLKGQTYVHALGREYLIRNLAYIVLCVVAAWTRNRRFEPHEGCPSSCKSARP
ncbi:hypothetical protein GGD56_002577 [Rhizobium mongolense]|nr:hypothetical protein [Rhizobium mongolense]